MAEIPEVDLDAILAALPNENGNEPVVVETIKLGGSSFRILDDGNTWSVYKMASSDFTSGVPEYILSRIHPDDKLMFDKALSNLNLRGTKGHEAIAKIFEVIAAAGSGHPTEEPDGSAPNSPATTPKSTAQPLPLDTGAASTA